LSRPIRLLRRFIRRSAAPLLDPFLDPGPAAQLIRETGRRQWRRLSLGLLMNITQALAEGATLGVVFFAVQVLSQGSQAAVGWAANPALAWLSGFTTVLQGLPVASLFSLLLLAAVVMKLVQSLAMYVGSVVMGYYNASVYAAVTLGVFRHILNFSFPCASRYPVGDLAYYAGGGPSAITTQINNASGFIMNLIQAVVYLGVLMSLSPWLLAAAAAMAGLLVLVQKQVLPRIRQRAFRSTEIAAEIATRITEDIQGLRLLHSTGQLDAATRGLQSRMGALEDNRRASSRLESILGPITVFLPIGMIALIAALSLLVFGGRSSGVLPSLVTFVIALQRLNGTFGAIAGNFSSLSSNAANLHRLNEILTTTDKQFRRAGGRPFPGLQQEIHLKNVFLRYSPDLPPALKGVDLTIRKGETVALVGSSGAGKSSIADLLVGLYDPTGGRILIDGEDLLELNLASWQQRLGVVSQDTFLFNTSLARNIAFGTPGATAEQIAEAARKAQAAGFIEALPDGYDTLVGERGYRLSGGQRQRLSLARAILREPDLLILDEATSALDTQSERLVQQAIEQFERQHTVLVIAHRLSTIVNADLICVMDQGMIVERGSHKELLANGKIYAGLWMQQTANAGHEGNPKLREIAQILET
jgi:ATP-binding cassette subfamily B protein/subfamily B ATP-binding cassette protein MsbA